VRRFARTLVLVLAAAAGLSAAGPAPSLVDAVKRGDREAVRAPAARQGGRQQARADGTTALHYAVEADALDLVTQLIRAGANVKAANRYGIPPITLAATNGSPKVLEALLEAGADPNARTAAGEPVLMTAARTGNPETVSRLQSRGADANAARAVVRRDGRHVGGLRRSPRRRAGARQGRRRPQRAIDGARGAGARVPAERRPQLAAAARRLDGVDVRGASGLDGAAQALVELGANLNAVALPETDVPLKGDEAAGVDKGDRHVGARLRDHQLALRSRGHAARQGRGSERGRRRG
jgi:hypothetical protein